LSSLRAGLSSACISPQYEVAYSSANERVKLVYLAGMFENLPFEVRLHAAWVGCQAIELDNLKAELRGEIGRQGYAILHGALPLANAA
jgi:hypothetical protein